MATWGWKNASHINRLIHNGQWQALMLFSEASGPSNNELLIWYRVVKSLVIKLWGRSSAGEQSFFTHFCQHCDHPPWAGAWPALLNCTVIIRIQPSSAYKNQKWGFLLQVQSTSITWDPVRTIVLPRFSHMKDRAEAVYAIVSVPCRITKPSYFS